MKIFYEQKADEGKLRSFLEILTVLLKNHFNRKVIVLIDEFDASLNNLVFIQKKNEEAKKV